MLDITHYTIPTHRQTQIDRHRLIDTDGDTYGQTQTDSNIQTKIAKIKILKN